MVAVTVLRPKADIIPRGPGMETISVLEGVPGTVRHVWIPAVTAKMHGSFTRIAVVDISFASVHLGELQSTYI